MGSRGPHQHTAQIAPEGCCGDGALGQETRTEGVECLPFGTDRSRFVLLAVLIESHWRNDAVRLSALARRKAAVAAVT